ncbi:TraB/GumN family protein [Pseudomonadota bacterium]
MLALSQSVLAGQADTALLWSIKAGERQAGFLLGTIHSEDPRVLDFPEEFLDMLSSNQVFAMEMVPDLPTLSRLTEYMQYQDGATLQSHIGAERFEKVTSVLSHYQMPAEWVAKMKVWATVMTLSVPPPETGFFMDFSLSLRAAGSGLRVVGLETLEEQLSFLEDMPMEQQLSLLDQALLEYDQVREVHDRMVDNYLAGNLQALAAEADSQLDQLDQETKEYFVGQGIDARNLRMLRAILPLLDQSQVFIAVGALHLPGESGLLSLLRGQGYRLEPLALPFNAEKH